MNLFEPLLQLNLQRSNLFKRFIRKKHFYKTIKKMNKQDVLKPSKEKTNQMRALEFFDNSFSPVYGARWPSVRLGLLSKQKYVAILNNYTNTQKTSVVLEQLGAFNVGNHYVKRAEEYTNNFRLKKVFPKKEKLEEENELLNQDRPSLRELTDEEMVDKYVKSPDGIYPEKFRKDSPGYETLSVDDESRILEPSVYDSDNPIFHNYVPSTELMGLEDWLEETDVFTEQTDYAPCAEIGVKVIKEENPIPWPENLKVYAFPIGDISNFPEPRGCSDARLCNYYLMGGASLLPVLAMNIQPGDCVFDMCAAPGGKSLIALQTLLPGLVVSNDIDNNRIAQIKRVRQQFFPNNVSKGHPAHVYSVNNGVIINDGEKFDKILVDSPCTNDRNSLVIHTGNWYSPAKTKKRLQLPETQCQLLLNAIKLVRPGGYVIYATCTLSPIQNDGVVHLALTKVWEQTKMTCAVIDMTAVFRCYSFMYRLGTTLGLRYGQVVLPNVVNNYGPMYIAKIQRLS